MDLPQYLMANGFNALITLTLFGLVLILFNWITPKIDFFQELKDRNYAVALVLIAFVLAIGMALFGSAK